MGTTTIRLDDELKARIARGAAEAGRARTAQCVSCSTPLAADGGTGRGRRPSSTASRTNVGRSTSQDRRSDTLGRGEGLDGGGGARGRRNPPKAWVARRLDS